VKGSQKGATIKTGRGKGVLLTARLILEGACPGMGGWVSEKGGGDRKYRAKFTGA